MQYKMAIIEACGFTSSVSKS